MPSLQAPNREVEMMEKLSRSIQTAPRRLVKEIIVNGIPEGHIEPQKILAQYSEMAKKMCSHVAIRWHDYSIGRVAFQAIELK